VPPSVTLVECTNAAEQARAESIHAGQGGGVVDGKDLMLLPVVPQAAGDDETGGSSNVRLHGVARKPSSCGPTRRTYCNADWVSFTAQ
jgi:hypothetical protein